MTWWMWPFLIVGWIVIFTLIFVVVKVMIQYFRQKHKQEAGMPPNIKNNPKSETTWLYLVDSVPKDGEKVQVITIRNQHEIRYLERVGDYVRVWKAYEDDFGIPVNEVIMWAPLITDTKMKINKISI